MNAGLEIVAEEIAAVIASHRPHSERNVHRIMRDLTERLAYRMPEGVRGFDAEEFVKACGLYKP